MGQGLTYQAWQNKCVQWPDYAVDLTTELLALHHQMQHRVSCGTQWDPPPPQTHLKTETNIYCVSFLRATGILVFPVEGCQGWAAIRTELQVNLLNGHMQDMVAVMKEGNRRHLHCPFCDILVTWEALNGLHINTNLCSNGEERKRLRLAI